MCSPYSSTVIMSPYARQYDQIEYIWAREDYIILTLYAHLFMFLHFFYIINLMMSHNLFFTLCVILFHLDCMGDFWPSCQGLKLSKVRIKGGVLGLINPPLYNIVYLIMFPNLGRHYYYTRVWRTHIEVKFHLLHVHA